MWHWRESLKWPAIVRGWDGVMAGLPCGCMKDSDRSSAAGAETFMSAAWASRGGYSDSSRLFFYAVTAFFRRWRGGFIAMGIRSIRWPAGVGFLLPGSIGFL